MAKLYPATQLSEDISIKSECDVAKLLCDQLPANVRIYHSYPWLNKEDRVLREGEADFVILDPRFGILIVEVKGGDIRYDPDKVIWYRPNGKHKPKDPFEQASKSHRYFERIIREREFQEFKELPFLRGRMVVFPDVEYKGHFPKGGCPEITVDARNLQNFQKRIKGIFEAQVGAHHIKDGLVPEVVDKIHQALYPNFKTSPALFRQIEHQEKAFLRFTDEQRNLVDAIVAGTNYRARVQGVAGSGKTVLASHLASHLADENPEGKVLFVCYNEQLANWIAEGLPPEYRERIFATHYHKLCSEWTQRAPGLQWPLVDSNDRQFWSERAPELLADAIEMMPDDRFDAVVVDEGQDFHSEWWDTLELIGKNLGNNPLLVFYDENQKIYDVGDSVAWPDLAGPFPLKYNCRNTQVISAYSGDFLGKNIPTKQGAPEGDAPVFKYVPDEKSGRTKVLSTARAWLNAGKLDPKQIAIVSTSALEKSCMAGETRIGNTPVTKSITDWRNGKGVLLTTVWKFKGLESDAMILSDAKGITQNFTKELAYVACSRAKHLLTIVSNEAGW